MMMIRGSEYVPSQLVSGKLDQNVHEAQDNASEAERARMLAANTSENVVTGMVEAGVVETLRNLGDGGERLSSPGDFYSTKRYLEPGDEGGL